MFKEETILKQIGRQTDLQHTGEEKEKCFQIIDIILLENPKLSGFLHYSSSYESFLYKFKTMVLAFLRSKPIAFQYYQRMLTGRDIYDRLGWRAIAGIRLLDYLDNEGKTFTDLNKRGGQVASIPFLILWKAVRENKFMADVAFFTDFLMLMRQYNGALHQNKPSHMLVRKWMSKHPSGLDAKVIEARKRNKDRIIRTLIRLMDEGKLVKKKYSFNPEFSFDQKYDQMLEWWKTRVFHLQFAVRKPELLNELLDNTLSEEILGTLREAVKKGIPIFVNPYYLSLIQAGKSANGNAADAAIRDYIFVSDELVREFGHIVAWEKEDEVEPGKPNAAGWLLPHRYNIHRRYPEVAILIPDTVGRACGGLCVSCQRMYDFQSGNLNFNLRKLVPDDTWWNRLPRLLEYFENDSKLRDILITGGDALMSSDKSLGRILQAVLEMTIRKKEANKTRPEGEKYAEIVRVRLGTRLPVYLPQRITPDLMHILADFKSKAVKAGIKQFYIQTHFETAMEITPEAKEGIRRLISAGWTVTNQLVFTASASRRGHTAKLRKMLNRIGVVSYYTFTVKGYAENSATYANNARAVQEQIEEKPLGRIPKTLFRRIERLPAQPEKIKQHIGEMLDEYQLPFLASDRNVLNLPGVGKSMTFRTIGITNDGRRILEFDHDHTRNHSPIVEKMGKMIIIESRSIADYLEKLSSLGEDIQAYDSIWGYSLGETEPRLPLYNYPAYDFTPTEEYTNLELSETISDSSGK